MVTKLQISFKRCKYLDNSGLAFLFASRILFLARCVDILSEKKTKLIYKKKLGDALHDY